MATVNNIGTAYGYIVMHLPVVVLLRVQTCVSWLLQVQVILLSQSGILHMALWVEFNSKYNVYIIQCWLNGLYL